jgi:hypothetical protein
VITYASPDQAAAEAAGEQTVEPTPSPGVVELEALGSSATPEAVAALVARRPYEQDAILARASQTLGNAFVGDLIAELQERRDAIGQDPKAPPPPPDLPPPPMPENDPKQPPPPPNLPPPPAPDYDPKRPPPPPNLPPPPMPDNDPKRPPPPPNLPPPPPPAWDPKQPPVPAPEPQPMPMPTPEPAPPPEPPKRTFRPTKHYPELADAEAWNREHVRNVVRFDRATGGQFAMMNGELDAQCVWDWQEAHGLVPTGRVEDDTCDVAEGKPPLVPAPSRDDDAASGADALA